MEKKLEKHICIVCEYGWIVCGIEAERDGETISLYDASVVRIWSNGRGIGAISKTEYKEEYTLDEIGKVDIRTNRVLFEIPCEW